jgi:hypothetical protein
MDELPLKKPGFYGWGMGLLRPPLPSGRRGAPPSGPRTPMAAANARSPLSEPPEAQLPPLDRLSLHDKPAVPITQLACMIEGHHTEVLCCVYSDRVVLFVTQLMKPGTIVEASRDTEGSGIAQYSQATLLGRFFFAHVFLFSTTATSPLFLSRQATCPDRFDLHQ